jgi:hypothetical protein
LTDWQSEAREKRDVTIHSPPEIEGSIRAAIHNGRFPLADAAMAEAASLLILQLEQERAQTAQGGAIANQAAADHRPIWEEFADIATSVPDEEWAKLPVDGTGRL